MLMADTMAIFFVFLGMMLAFPGLWLLCRGLWSPSVIAASARCKRRIWPSFLIGIPVVVLLIFATVIFSKLPGAAGKISAIALVSIFVLHASIGVAGLATSIGERLGITPDSKPQYKSTLIGGIVLELSFLLPVLGWFLILPGSYIIGSGLAFQNLLSRAGSKSEKVIPGSLDSSPIPHHIEVNLDEPFGAAR